MQRRTFLKTAASVPVFTTGASWYAYGRGVFSVGAGPAFEPWKNWRDQTGQRSLALVRAALLAASPHNTQPWRFKVSPSSIEMHIDRERNVGPLDPYLREEYIGMGCALENLMLAAPANSFCAAQTLSPGKLTAISPGQPSQPVARVDLAPGLRQESDLYQAIPRRHTNRSVFDRRRTLPPAFVQALRQLSVADENVKLFLFTAEADRNKLVELSSAANGEIYSDPRVAAASERWIRLRWEDVQRFRDGLTIDAFGLSPAMSALAKTLPTRVLSSIAAKSQQSGYAERMLAAPLIGLIAVRDRYDCAQSLSAGRLWQRAHLFATVHNIAARPGNEAMEMVDYERALGRPAGLLVKLGRITRDPSWQPTFLFLMGYSTIPANASPRRPIQFVINT